MRLTSQRKTLLITRLCVFQYTKNDIGNTLEKSRKMPNKTPLWENINKKRGSFMFQKILQQKPFTVSETNTTKKLIARVSIFGKLIPSPPTRGLITQNLKFSQHTFQLLTIHGISISIENMKTLPNLAQSPYRTNEMIVDQIEPIK